MGPLEEIIIDVGRWIELAQDSVHLQDFNGAEP